MRSSVAYGKLYFRISYMNFPVLVAILHETYCRFRNASGLSVHVRNVHDMQRNMRALFHMVKVKKHIQVGFQETVPLLKVFQFLGDSVSDTDLDSIGP